MTYKVMLLDPNDLNSTTEQLAHVFDLAADSLPMLRRILALFPRSARLHLNLENVVPHENLPLVDKFTFNLETDELILFSQQFDVLIDALIEMAMYLTGFATMLGNDEEWVVEFTVGAWKPVKKRVKRQLSIPVNDHPNGIVGLPPSPENSPDNDPYPFRTLVSNYDLGSFHQMVMLAARDDIAVYFPPETHPKVLAVYVYMRRAMQEVAQGLDLNSFQTFNTRLVESIHRLDTLFTPSSLMPPTWLDKSTRSPEETTNPRDLFPGTNDTHHTSSSTSAEDNPFETFFKQLFSDDDPEND